MDTINLMVCRLPERQYNWGIVMLLWRFWKIPVLFITIIYPNVSILYTPCYNAFETFLYLNIAISTNNCKFVTKLLWSTRYY
jgi:hypothetical protein